ncbi:hypothetical protein H8F24_18560 [Synechococcus sp. CBW1002]|jgi:hypothetical protein|uniref:hypothetical protein n=1 Tax=Synechococcus sp. CBW1002 TaxID=1353134 RepID=UPI0018CC7E58|nr:hypothetical protein [Synechococcus sp. CBW1002]QPN59895.1 hypothetical protein H8F24_18560 [Synechococcus sp. CBW1002]
MRIQDQLNWRLGLVPHDSLPDPTLPLSLRSGVVLINSGQPIDRLMPIDRLIQQADQGMDEANHG